MGLAGGRSLPDRDSRCLHHLGRVVSCRAWAAPDLPRRSVPTDARLLGRRGLAPKPVPLHSQGSERRVERDGRGRGLGAGSRCGRLNSPKVKVSSVDRVSTFGEQVPTFCLRVLTSGPRTRSPQRAPWGAGRGPARAEGRTPTGDEVDYRTSSGTGTPDRRTVQGWPKRRLTGEEDCNGDGTRPGGAKDGPIVSGEEPERPAATGSVGHESLKAPPCVAQHTGGGFRGGVSRVSGQDGHEVRGRAHARGVPSLGLDLLH